MSGSGLTGLGRAAWSTKYQEAQSIMAVGLGKAADEEARAEVEVLNSRLEKTRILNAKLAACLGRLETSGKSVKEAVGPLYGNTQKLQVLGSNIDGVISAIAKIRQPSDIKSDEEEIIRKGPDKAGLASYLSSVKRINKSLGDLKTANLRSNQEAMADLGRLLKFGNTQLEGHFQKILQDDSRPLEPLMFITKDKPFPALSQDKTTRLGLINSYIASYTRQSGSGDSPMLQLYASVRGPYLTATLQNLAAASINTAKKKNPDAIYRQGTNGMGTYASGMEGAFSAEHENIVSLFSRDEWGRVFNLTCQGAISELARTLRELNSHIKANLTTDCFLAYEIIEIMSSLSSNMESKTGELKPSFAAALKPIRETGKSSLAELLDDTRRRVANIPAAPIDGASMPITTETMTRLVNMVDFLRPISSIMISIGDGGWKSSSSNNNSTDQIPSLKSFDVSADGKQIFAHYCIDTIETLLNALDQKAKVTMKGNKQGIFIANNATVIQRMVRTSELQPILSTRMADIEKWRKNGTTLYSNAWREPCTHLLDTTYTNRSARPQSGSAQPTDSATIVKALSSKDKEAVKEKFKAFNASFDEFVAKHKTLAMEKELRESLARQAQQMVEPLYNRFWDRYHEVDKGKGKYVKYDKAALATVFASLS